jgi:hypothetical protein
MIPELWCSRCDVEATVDDDDVYHQCMVCGAVWSVRQEPYTNGEELAHRLADLARTNYKENLR